MPTTTDPSPPTSREVHRQAITEETLAALEKVIKRYRHNIAAMEGGGSGPSVNPDALSGELAGHLAHLRSKLYRYTQLG